MYTVQYLQINIFAKSLKTYFYLILNDKNKFFQSYNKKGLNQPYVQYSFNNCLTFLLLYDKKITIPSVTYL